MMFNIDSRGLHKIIYTLLKELDEKRKNGVLLDSKNYVPFEVERNVHVSKLDETEDTNTVTIKLFDHF